MDLNGMNFLCILSTVLISGGLTLPTNHGISWLVGMLKSPVG